MSPSRLPGRSRAVEPAPSACANSLRHQEEIARTAPAIDRPREMPARAHHGPEDVGGGGTTLTISGTEPIVSPGTDTTSVPMRDPGAGGNAARGSALTRRRSRPSDAVGTSADSA